MPLNCDNCWKSKICDELIKQCPFWESRENEIVEVKIDEKEKEAM